MDQGSVFDYLGSGNGSSIFLYFGILGGIILAGVVALVYYFSYRYRGAPGDPEPPRRHYNDRLETWLMGGFALLTGLFLYLAVSRMQLIQDIPEVPRPDVIVTGHQWWWEARYPDGDVVVANELHLPAGRRVLLQLESADVIHDWWVPGLGRKMDMIPGVTNYVWAEAREPGEYLGSCSEFCGAQHARMRLRVVVDEESEFRAWKERQGRPAPGTDTDAAVAAGRELFTTKACATCHAVRGTTAAGNVAPDLTHFAGRRHMLSDLLETNADNLRAWLRDPQAVKPGALMPDFLLTTTEVEQLTAYLMQLQ